MTEAALLYYGGMINIWQRLKIASQQVGFLSNLSFRWLQRHANYINRKITFFYANFISAHLCINSFSINWWKVDSNMFTEVDFTPVGLPALISNAIVLCLYFNLSYSPIFVFSFNLFFLMPEKIKFKQVTYMNCSDLRGVVPVWLG